MSVDLRDSPTGRLRLWIAYGVGLTSPSSRDVEALLAERDELAASVDRVRALADRLANAHGMNWSALHARDLRAALNGTEAPYPASAPPCEHEQKLAAIRAYLDEGKGAYPPDLYEILERP